MRAKFRIYHECQNGHGRFLYVELTKDGFKNNTDWGEKEKGCKCPTFDFGEGFTAKSEPEQFTGLQDKNGTEIYEGDVVKYHINDSNFDLGIIEWCHDTWKFVYKYLDNSTSIWESRMEVIGNIHETKN